MNTDNMSIAGETIDYGPCAFMDVYHPGTVYCSIDNMRRYAYGNQPRVAEWNLARLAETLLPLLAEDKDTAVKEAQQAIDAFATSFETAYAAGLSRKLGLFQPRPDDLSLAQDLLDRMARNGADFTLIFRRLCDAAASPDGDAGVRSLFTDPSSFDDWAARWRHRLAEEGGEANERRAAMRAANPAFIPRNHLVEEAISAAVNDGYFPPFEAREVAEDAASTKVVRSAGLKVRLVDRPFPQPLGDRSAAEVWSRQLRWARLRRASFFAYFLPEALSDGVLPMIVLACVAPALGLPPGLSAVSLGAVWYGGEMVLAAGAGWHLSALYPLYGLARDLLLPVLFVSALRGDDFVWRGNEMQVERLRPRRMIALVQPRLNELAPVARRRLRSLRERMS
jgi:Protein adenylyltransferase SelO/Glycosyl transferase family 21